MTWVSSECRRFLSLHVPFPSAARSSARLEILFEPGVAIVTGLFRGMPATTLTASESVFAMTLSATTVAFCSYVAPILDRITIFFWGPLFFLSIFMMSRRRSTPRPFAAGRLAMRGVRECHREVVCAQTARKAADGDLTEDAKLARDLRFEDHPDADALAMQDGGREDCLDRMTNGASWDRLHFWDHRSTSRTFSSWALPSPVFWVQL